MSDYTVSQGWGQRATPTERAVAHVQMTAVMAGDDTPARDSAELKEATAFYLSSIIADLLALANQEGLTLTDVIQKAIMELDENQ